MFYYNINFEWYINSGGAVHVCVPVAPIGY